MRLRRMGLEGAALEGGHPPCGQWWVTCLCVAKKSPKERQPPPIRSPSTSPLVSATALTARADGPSMAC